MRRWLFQVVLNTGDGSVEATTVEVVAPDSYAAIDELPGNTISWDFAQYDDGMYSQPVLVAV